MDQWGNEPMTNEPMLERLLAATENGSEWRMARANENGSNGAAISHDLPICRPADLLEWLLATTNFQPRPICHDCRPSDLPNAELPNAV
jgi:hypothetical protein